MESHVYFFESGTMKITFYFGLSLSVVLLISGCELLCQAGTGTCGLSSEERYKLLHPKAYGEYFVKPGAARQEWQRDWVACGGRHNGQYSDDAPPNATTKEIFSAIEKAKKSLTTCMQSKGYEFRKD
jgi:hypothetical protein